MDGYNPKGLNPKMRFKACSSASIESIRGNSMRCAHILLCLLILIGATALVVASEVAAAEDLEIFAGQDKKVRVSVALEFNDARILKPDPLDPDRTYTFSWDFDGKKDGNLDGNPTNDGDSTEQFTEWTYHIPGTYTVTLTVSDGFETATKTLTVTVEENRPPTIHANDTEQAFKEEDHTFYADAIDDQHQQHLLRWHWEFGDGTSTDEPPPVVHRFMAVRGYQVKVRVTDPDTAFSEHTIFINVVEKPGELGSIYEVKDGKLNHKGKQIRENGYIAYKIDLKNRHEIEIKVTAISSSPPVAVLVFGSENNFLDYELEQYGSWYIDLSRVEPNYNHKISWEAQEDQEFYIVIDNGYQTGGGFGSLHGMATVDVSIEDKDRDNFFVDIPFIVWIVIIGVIGVFVIFQVAMRLLERQTVKRKEVEAIHQTMAGRDTAVTSLRSFLDNPEDIVTRESAMAKAQLRAGPRPGPGMPPGPGGPPMAGPGPRGPPGRPAGSPQGRPAGPPGAPPSRPPMAAPAGPTEAPPEAPGEGPKEPSEEPSEAPDEAPPETPKIVDAPAPEDMDAPKLVASEGPVYEATEQPKRMSGFSLDETPETSESSETPETSEDTEEE
jgi:PKD repeat protein